MKNKVELFISGCSLCEPMLEMVVEACNGECDIKTYDVSDQCDSEECIQKIREYEIECTPSVAINGRLLDCCKEEINKEVVLEALGNKS